MTYGANIPDNEPAPLTKAIMDPEKFGLRSKAFTRRLVYEKPIRPIPMANNIATGALSQPAYDAKTTPAPGPIAPENNFVLYYLRIL